MNSDWTLTQGDSLALLRDLPTASVDALITDPPYSSGGMMRGDRTGATNAKYGGDSLVNFTGDNRDQRAFHIWCSMWLADCVRIVRPGGVIILFSDWRQMPTVTDALQVSGFVWRGIVPWVKHGARPCLGRFTNICEYAIWGSNGPMPVEGPTLAGFYKAASPSAKEREHITQKPLEVMRELVKICPPGGVVLDPFAGSGSTGVAALLEGRRFIGFELSEHYAEVAERRLAEAAGEFIASGQPGLFDPVGAPS